MNTEKNHKTNWSIIGAMGAAIAASACCTIPLLLVVLGVGGAWVGTFTALEPYRPLFILLALGFLGFVGYREYRLATVRPYECFPTHSRRSARCLFRRRSG